MTSLFGHVVDLIKAKMKTAILPTRKENFTSWYLKVIENADLAEHSDSRGCMIIKPWGYEIWDNIRSRIDQKIKSMGCQNAYFPTLIPLHYLEKEAQHIDGFAKECAVVTHHGLKKCKDGKLYPDSQLAQPYIMRPTSETIVGESFKKWIRSYKDLPLKINQWANVFRWEMRPRMFLRNSEFLWQEGHTAHSNNIEAMQQTIQAIDLYQNFINEILAIDTIKGKKVKDEKFPGAEDTYTLESMMQSKRALQMATSHFMGQTFAKVHNIMFMNKKQQYEYCYTTSWGVSTRLIGALIMSHGDDNGLILPPMITPFHIVIIPLGRDDNDLYIRELKLQIEAKSFDSKNIKVKVSSQENVGQVFWHWVKKGVPIIVQVGQKEIKTNTVKVVYRNTNLEPTFLSIQEFIAELPLKLESIQQELYTHSKKLLLNNMQDIESNTLFKEYFEDKNAGFAAAYTKDSPELSSYLENLKVTPRCIISDSEDRQCIFTNQPTNTKILFARAY
jgi:prolyl-tRNA synthetase